MLPNVIICSGLMPEFRIHRIHHRIQKWSKVRDMKRKEFSNWNEHLSIKYKLEKKDTEGNSFKLMDITWMNFGWRERRDLSTRKCVMEPHPDQVFQYEQTVAACKDFTFRG
ncbi:hypothetical protein ACROYT_G014896 [Oculina patagonica]